MRIDEDLVCRLEASAAQASFELINELKAKDPTGPAEAKKFQSGALLFGGPQGCINRALGVTQGDLSAEQFEEIEQFYIEKNGTPMIELSSWAPDSTVEEFAKRGYQPVWFRAMYAAAVSGYQSSVDAGITVELSEVEDGIWPETIALAYGITEPAKQRISDDMAAAGRGVSSAIFYARVDGEVAGCALVQVANGIAWLGPAVTHPDFRRRGVQTALLAARMRLAENLGCEYAAATAHPHGDSARNVLRVGFTHTHTQVVMSLPS